MILHGDKHDYRSDSGIQSRQRETWSMGNFGDMAVFTTPVAGHLVRYARVTGEHEVLDVGQEPAWPR